jgi:hypothetical protein
MDAFASPSIRGEKPGYGGIRIAEAALLTLAMGFSLFGVLIPPSTGLDTSWQAMLIHAHAQHLQFGRDIVFTWGPWGFLCSMVHLGSLAAEPILVWQVAGKLLVAFALVVLTRSLVFWRRMAFAAALLALHWVFQDTVYFVLIALVVVAGLMRTDSSDPSLVAWTFLLGFLSQFKFTYFILASAGVVAAMACWGLRGAPRRSGSIAVGFAFAVLAAWVAAGQHLGNLYPYLRQSMEISSGYAGAMGFDEPRPVFLWGLGLVLMFLIFIGGAWRSASDRALATGSCAYLSLSVFVVWKESFIRADLVPLGGHVFGLFTYILMLGPALPGLVFPGRRWHWFDCSIPLCLAGIACVDAEFCFQAPRVAWQIIYGQAQALENLGNLPQVWQRSFEEESSAVDLPRTRSAVGNGTVDVYDFSIGIALLNGLRLSSRPVFQSYSAYTPSLEGINLKFFQSPRAPDYLLWKGEDVDARYPGQDDAQLVSALPGHYEAMFEEGGYWLFRKRSPVSDVPSLRGLMIIRTVMLSDEIELPSSTGHAIWLHADPIPTPSGRLRGILYKPALINIATTDERGETKTWRLVPQIAKDGFILVPTLADGRDLALLMEGKTRTMIRSFHFEAPEGEARYWSHVNVQVFELPGLPIHLVEPGSKP